MRKILFLLCTLLGTVGAWADPISDVSQLSNSKVYSVVTERGAWKAESANMGYNASITDAADVPNDDSYKFAILKQGDYFFLYSVSAGKFINPQKYFTTIMPTPLSIENLGNGVMKMTSSNPSKAINIGGQWTWDGWTTTDGGNRLTITEVGDIDPTAALAMLTTKVYTVSCQRGSWAVTSDHTALTAHNASNASSNDADKQFALFTIEGKMYLYSVGAEKFVKSDGSLFDGKGDPITYQSTNDASYPYQFYFPLPTQIYFNLQDGAGSIQFNTWSAQDQGNKYQIASVTSADVAAITAKAEEVFYGTQTITYTIKINGNTVATETREHKVGETASLSSAYTSKEYVTYSYSPTTIAAGTTDVEVTATVGTLPFEVSANFDNAHWYNLKIGAQQRYVGWEDSEPYHTHADNEATEFVRAHDTYQWAFMGNPVSGIKVVNRHTGASYSLTSEGTGTNVNGTDGIPNTVLRSGDHYWDIHENGAGFSLNLIGKSNYYINTHGGATGYFQIWQSSGARTDAGSRMTVAEVPDLSTTVTYNVSYNGSVVYTTSVPGVIGDAVGDLPSDVTRDYVEITGHDATATITRDMTVALTATWKTDAPFELADSYANAHWYDMSVRDTWYVTSDNVDSDGALATVNANAMGLAEDAYQWAFVGDPWHIQLFNKDKGSSEVYAWTSTDNSSIPAFVGASSENYWWIRKSTNSDAVYTNAFLLTIPEYGYQVNQFGGAGGTLKIWTSNGTGDPGSAFKVFDVPTDFHEFAVAEIQPSATATGYFAFTDAVKSNIGWQDSYATSCPFETYKNMKLALEAIDMTDMSNFVLPETGYYTLKNKNYGTYMGIDPSDANMYGNYTTATAAKQIVKLTKNANNTYTIGLMGKYAPATVTRSAQVTANATAGTYTVVIPVAGYAAFKANPSEQYSALHCAGGGSIVGWEAVAAASQWEVKDAESIQFTISDKGDGWATAYLPFPYTIPEGVTAYTGTVNGSALTLTEIEGTIPASTAVVLKGTANSTPTFTIATTEPAAITENDLKGSYDPVPGGENISALAKKDGVVGFYPVGSDISVPVGKAYLDTSAGIKGFTFVFEDNATGIENLNVNANLNGAIYNVAGQRLNKVQKGINIVNGKKILK
jgi:hypothetical protein